MCALLRYVRHVAVCFILDFMGCICCPEEVCDVWLYVVWRLSGDLYPMTAGQSDRTDALEGKQQCLMCVYGGDTVGEARQMPSESNVKCMRSVLKRKLARELCIVHILYMFYCWWGRGVVFACKTMTTPVLMY